MLLMLEFLENKSTCIHSRKIFALIDTDKIQTLADHQCQCTNCRDNYAKIQTILQEIDRKIPLVEMTPEEHRETKRYLTQLLKKFHKKKGILSYLPW